jgi:hypothetical protein
MTQVSRWSATDKGLNRTKASSQSPDGGYVRGRRISRGCRMTIRTKSRIVQDGQRMKDGYLDAVQNSHG